LVTKIPEFLEVNEIIFSYKRVVIGSGNLTGGDWIIWSNCLWYKDFPKKSSIKDIPKKKKTGEFDFDQDFEDTLKSFIQSLMPNKARYTDILDLNLDDYYYSGIDIVMIPSIPGRHKDEALDKYGHRKVAYAIKKLFANAAPKTKRRYVLTYQTSSVGNLDEKFLREILSSFIPNYLTLDDLRNEKKVVKKKSGDISFSSGVPDTAAKRTRMIFPTKDYVENCNEGPQYSNCLILNPDTYNKDSFCKEILHKFSAPEDYAFHEGIIPHLKVFVVCDESGEIDDDSLIYFGSHNFSPSAWGKFEKEYSQLSISNTELGVLLPPMKGINFSPLLIFKVQKPVKKK
jgi:tyrosyl-DNA phosphodiesterase 1